MKDQEKIQDFAAMVEATQKLSKPWKTLAFCLVAATIVSNLAWAIVFATF